MSVHGQRVVRRRRLLLRMTFGGRPMGITFGGTEGASAVAQVHVEQWHLVRVVRVRVRVRGRIGVGVRVRVRVRVGGGIGLGFMSSSVVRSSQLRSKPRGSCDAPHVPLCSA